MTRSNALHCPHCNAVIPAGNGPADSWPGGECRQCHALLRARTPRWCIGLLAGWGLLSLAIIVLALRRGIFVGPCESTCLLLPAGTIGVACMLIRRVVVVRRPHECRACGYDVRTTFGDKCPECGTPLPAHLAKQPRKTA